MSSLMAEIREVADHENLRMRGDAHVRLHDHAARPVQLRACLLRKNHAERRRQHARGPQHGARGNNFVPISAANCDAVSANVRDHRAGSNRHTEPLQHAPRGFGKLRRVRWQRAVRAFHQDDARLRGIDRAEIVAQRIVSDFAQRARQLCACGPCAHDHERHPRLQLFRIALALRRFERKKDAAAHCRGVIQIFQARRELLPFVVAEILMCGAGSDDQRVVIQHAIAENHAALGSVNVHGFAQQHLRVFLFMQDVTQRARNVRGRKRAGGNLVKQRLK